MSLLYALAGGGGGDYIAHIRARELKLAEIMRTRAEWMATSVPSDVMMGNCLFCVEKLDKTE